MYTYPNTPGEPLIKRKSTTTSRYYDENGRLTSEDVTEEVEYYQPVTNPNPWIVTNASNVQTVGTRTFMEANDPEHVAGQLPLWPEVTKEYVDGLDTGGKHRVD